MRKGHDYDGRLAEWAQLLNSFAFSSGVDQLDSEWLLRAAYSLSMASIKFKSQPLSAKFWLLRGHQQVNQVRGRLVQIPPPMRGPLVDIAQKLALMRRGNGWL